MLQVKAWGKAVFHLQKEDTFASAIVAPPRAIAIAGTVHASADESALVRRSKIPMKLHEILLCWP